MASSLECCGKAALLSSLLNSSGILLILHSQAVERSAQSGNMGLNIHRRLARTESD